MVAATKTIQVQRGLERGPLRSIGEFSFITVTELALGGVAAEAVGLGVEVTALEGRGAQLGVEHAEVPRERLPDGREVQHDDGDPDASVRHCDQLAH